VLQHHYCCSCFAGFAVLLFSRLFCLDGAGDFQAKLWNDILGLPVKDLAEATKVAVKMAKMLVRC
jgi:hypothetical protein